MVTASIAIIPTETFPILVGNEDLHKKRNEEVKICGSITIKWRN